MNTEFIYFRFLFDDGTQEWICAIFTIKIALLKRVLSGLAAYCLNGSSGVESRPAVSAVHPTAPPEVLI